MTENEKYAEYEEYLKGQIESAKRTLESNPNDDMEHGLYSAFSRALEKWRRANR